MKKDKYLRVRGGTARMLDIHCAKCGAWILKYQKDGVGQLLRCYLNRFASRWPTTRPCSRVAYAWSGCGGCITDELVLPGADASRIHVDEVRGGVVPDAPSPRGERRLSQRGKW